jgi:class 3 adenylate cyclase/tetratricopeptide (TPR) repeat protein
MAGTDERKPVTVLFADLAGSTELATRHDPEHLRALLSAFFDEMRQHIEAFGGTVEKYAGDAVMAVFGVPRVYEDDAERAVRAAVAMGQSLEQLNPMFEQQYGVRLALRVGVATGEAVAATESVKEFLVTGDVANLAARLQGAGEGVVVSQATYRLLQPLLDAEPMPPLELKGFAGPVTAYRVTGLRAVDSRPRGIPGLSSPVVGRDRELDTLRACIEDLRQRRGQVVVIVGEAGIGKSRLKIEIRDSLPEGMRWLEGRCQAYTQSTSYAPVIQILRAAIGLGPADPTPIARVRLRAMLRELAGSRAEALLPALAHVLGVDAGQSPPADPRALQSQIVLATRAVLEGLAGRGPLVLAVEDLHWADAASVELLSVIIEMTDFLPLMILVTCRPETEGEAWAFRFHAERNYGHRLTEVRLAALAPESSARLADNLLRVAELPETLRRLVLDRAEGNPFFLEEILRGLIEEGVLYRDGERWVAAGDSKRWTLPTTLRGVLAARIDRLPAGAKKTLQRASVVGRFFTHGALRALADPEEELDRSLAHLLRAELIRESARLPERQYVFKHVLTREATYSSILGEPRRALHAQVARHLEEAGGERVSEQSALLAEHWREAEDWDRALHYTLKAAERARALYARPEAVGHHWQALDLLARLPDAPAHRRVQVEVVTQLLALPGWARSQPERERGLRLLAEAIPLAEALGEAGLSAQAEAQLAWVPGGHGDEASLVRAVTRARAVSDRRAETFTLRLHIDYLGFAGRFEEALTQLPRAIELCGELGDRFQQGLLFASPGRCWGARAGRLTDSLVYAARAREVGSQLDDARLKAWRAMEAEPYGYKGLWDDVVRVAEENLPIAWEIGEHTVIVFVSAWLGMAYLKLGRPDEARRVTTRGLAHAETRFAGNPFAFSYARMARALAHLADGELSDALDQARRALELAERSRGPLEQGGAHRVLGQIHEAMGRRAESEGAYRRSLEILEGIQSLPELGQTLLAYGRFQLADDPGAGRTLIERARALFARIDATGWVLEADLALAPRQ